MDEIHIGMDVNDTDIIHDMFIDNDITNEKIVITIGTIQKLKIKIFGKTFISKKQLSGWKEALPFYAFKCPYHGYQISYLNTFKKQLICPECIMNI